MAQSIMLLAPKWLQQVLVEIDKWRKPACLKYVRERKSVSYTHSSSGPHRTCPARPSQPTPCPTCHKLSRPSCQSRTACHCSLCMRCTLLSSSGHGMCNSLGYSCRLLSLTTTPSLGVMVIPVARAGTLGAPGSSSKLKCCTSRTSAIRASASANLLPTQKRLPPPKGM